jgi:glycosyltransferase involved in cell wall biosynthesis
MIQISAVIITYNEERNIERCLLSLKELVDDMIVLDSFSNDHTQSICEKYGVRFYQAPFKGYIEQKNNALKFAKHNYVLSLDADEVISEKLKESILKVKEYWDADGYYFNRLNNFCGSWIRHSNWYPDSKLRLWDIRKGEWEGTLIHEKVKMNQGAVIRFLEGDLLHYSYNSKKEFIDRTHKYALMSAEGMYLRGKKPSYLKLIFSPAWRFIKSYILGRGFLDGSNGFIISWYLSKGVYSKYRELFTFYKHKNA